MLEVHSALLNLCPRPSCVIFTHCSKKRLWRHRIFSHGAVGRALVCEIIGFDFIAVQFTLWDVVVTGETLQSYLRHLRSDAVLCVISCRRLGWQWKQISHWLHGETHEIIYFALLSPHSVNMKTKSGCIWFRKVQTYPIRSCVAPLFLLKQTSTLCFYCLLKVATFKRLLMSNWNVSCAFDKVNICSPGPATSI